MAATIQGNNGTPTIVSYLGPSASYTHQVTLTSFEPSVHQYKPEVEIKDVFEAVQSGSSEYGVVPFENSTHGAVVFTLDLLADRLSSCPNVCICDEAYLRVSHYLVGRKASSSTAIESSPEILSGTCTPTHKIPNPSAPKSKPLSSIRHIQKIYSHQQAFGQCEAFLSTYAKGVERLDTSSTSKAAEHVKEMGSSTSAAIASKLAAEVHGLDILAECVEDRDDNTTRFFIIRKGSPSQGSALRHQHHEIDRDAKSLVSFTIDHRSPGALADVLHSFRRYKLNLTSINTRPTLVKPFQYIFFLEFEGSKLRDPKGHVTGALKGLDQFTLNWRWLGSWIDRSEQINSSSRCFEFSTRIDTARYRMTKEYTVIGGAVVFNCVPLGVKIDNAAMERNANGVMMLDQLSPVAPARVKILLLPVGKLQRARFLSFVERLQPEIVVQLGDISPDGRPNRNMFSPLAFPTGRIIYDLITYCPLASYRSLYPFEIFREPLVIIAVADGSELEHVSYKAKGQQVSGNRPSILKYNLRELYQQLEEVRDTFPRSLVHQLFLFDYVKPKGGDPLPEGLVSVPPPAECKTTTLKTLMCDVSSLLLAEMTTLARSFQALNTIESPGLTMKNINGPLLAVEELAVHRNSQLSLGNSRSGSPVDRSHVRMSMPAQIRSDSNSSLPRPSTPPNGFRNGSPTTFEDIIRPGSADMKGAAKASPLSRSGVTDTYRDSSRDRVSNQGFGSDSLSERARSKGKARVGLVIGSIYLCAGRWNDALRELSDSASLAKVNLDHLWHAKALDGLLISMIMLAWAGLDFYIPQICYTNAEKVPTNPESKGSATSRLVSLHNLNMLLPELLDRILNLYSRVGNHTVEALPQLLRCETVIRSAKLLAAVHLANGVMNNELLEFLVLGTPLSKSPTSFPSRVKYRPSRTDIVLLIFRAFPVPPSDPMPSIDRVVVLGGIASVLGSLGYNRKKALVIRELVSVLIPGLVQARIRGAANIGVHPAAGLAALGTVNGSVNGAAALDLAEGDIENGVDSFLGLLTEIYGVVVSESSKLSNGNQYTPVDDSDEAVIARVVHNAYIRLFGSKNIKMDVLRSCINLSEALPDFNGVLTFTVDLLRTAGSGVAPGPRHNASPMISSEEQIRLATNISRTLNAARNLGVQSLEADYWDEFLVRGVLLEPLPSSRTLISRDKKELPGAVNVATSHEVNPFIYNPFLKAPVAAAVDHLMVAGEAGTFKVILQNPYDFELAVEFIKLETEGIDFESSMQGTIVGPYRTQILTLLGTPLTPGILRVTGCIIRVRGCRERRFPIFTEPWSPQPDFKVKAIGLATLSRGSSRPTTTTSKQPMITPTMLSPKTTVINLKVINTQPVVVIRSTTLAQSAVMVLEGERQVFSITLQNLSRDTPVNFVLFSFTDSTQAPLRTAMCSRDASAAELYEYELIHANKQALKWKVKSQPFIGTGATSVFEMEVLGKPGLTGGTIQVDYGFLGVPQGEVKDIFYTRQVSLPITVTVNASIELARLDAMPLTGSIPRSLWSSIKQPEKVLYRSEDYCLLLLDFRNTWPSNLRIHLNVTDVGTIEEEILPGNMSRILIPLRRIFLTDPYASIPALDPFKQRQFVVNASRIFAEAERVSRETFWYREAVLNMLRGSWSTTSGPHRQGDIELRGLKLSQRVIEIIAVEEINIEVSVDGVKSGEKYEIPADSFSCVTTRITNRSRESIFPFLRLQPSNRHHPQYASVDLSNKLVWNGVLQQTLPMIPGGESAEVTVGLTALCKGEYEIGASVEEIKILEAHNDQTKESWENRRPRTHTNHMLDAALGAKSRRIWHCRDPCLLIVGDAESSNDSDNADNERDVK